MFRTLILAVTLTAIAALSPAHAVGPWFAQNGTSMNGLTFNGLPFNGRSMQGRNMQGVEVNGVQAHHSTGGVTLLGIELPAAAR